jgi:FtsZ-binding cell division protein ZapB
MFEETINTYTNAARRAKQNLNPGGVVSDDYSVKEFICQSVDVVNLLGRRVDELIKFNGAPASEQQQQLLALQAENSRLTALFNDAHSQYEKLQKETDRLRLELEADTLNSRTSARKCRNA